jgi:DNA-3-methyladenine glycosylase
VIEAAREGQRGHVHAAPRELFLGEPSLVPDGSSLGPAFYARDALGVARDLLGALIVRRTADGVVALRITETEAYRHPDDSANHCRAGRTRRNWAMWGPPGHAYVYVCYGLHAMLNLVTGRDGEGAAVLIRAAEVVAGLELVQARRGTATLDPAALLAGPGKVG